MTPADIPPASEPERPARAGFSLPFDIVVAPGRAFLKIAKTGEWVPALVVIAVFGLATGALALPAIVHIETLATPGPPRPSPGQIQSAVMVGLAYQALFVPIFVAVLTAMTLTVVARFKDPHASFGRFFSLAVNCQVPTALGGLLEVVPVALRGPAAFPDLRALVLAVPLNLGVFAVPGNERELEFLQHFDIFDVWASVLLAFGFSAFAGVRFAWALVIAFALDLFFAFVFL